MTKIRTGQVTNSSEAWASFTPTITAVSGTFTTVSATGKFSQVGKTVYVTMAITITTNGTAAGAILSTLPVTAKDTNSYVGSGRGDVVSGKQQQCRLNGTASVAIYNYDGTYGGATGETMRIALTYEAA